MASPVAAGYLLNRAQNQLSRTLSDEPGEIAELSRRRAMNELNMKRMGRESKLQEPALKQAEMFMADADSPFTLGALIGEGRNAPNVAEHLFYGWDEGDIGGSEPTGPKPLIDRFGDVMNAYVSPSEQGPVYKERGTDRVLTKADVSKYWPQLKGMYQASMSVKRVLRAAGEELEARKSQMTNAEYKAAKARLENSNSPESKIRVTQEFIRAGESVASVNPSVRSDLERHYKNIEKWEGQIQKRLDREWRGGEFEKDRQLRRELQGPVKEIKEETLVKMYARIYKISETDAFDMFRRDELMGDILRAYVQDMKDAPDKMFDEKLFEEYRKKHKELYGLDKGVFKSGQKKPEEEWNWRKENEKIEQEQKMMIKR